MSRERILNTLRPIIAKRFDVESAFVVGETSLGRDLDADSLDLIALAGEIEEEFDVEVPDQFSRNVGTVDDIVELLVEKLMAKRSDFYRPENG